MFDTMYCPFHYVTPTPRRGLSTKNFYNAHLETKRNFQNNIQYVTESSDFDQIIAE